MKRQIIFFILTLLTMGVIFGYSSRDSNESEEDSVGVGMFIGHLFVPEFDELSDKEQYEYAKKIDHPVRKTAHFTEYMILGLFVLGTLYPKKETKNKKSIISSGFIALLITAIYAGTDEFHQTFVPGRAGRLSDVLIDSSGALLGIFVVTLISLIRFKNKKKNEEKY